MAEFVREIQNIIDIREIFRINLVPQRNFKQRINPLEDLTVTEFRKSYRLSKDAVKFVVELISEELTTENNNKYNIPAVIQVLIALRYYAKGCYQIELADLHGVSQASVSRIVTRVSKIIARKSIHFIKFPQQTDKIKEEFYNVANFPGIIGCIDNTHVRVKNPLGEQLLVFCNRKGFYSLNIQVVCDANTKILNIVAKWRGSAHDSRIWNNSKLKEDLEESRLKGILLGDSGFPCSRYLLTPLLNPQNQSERLYNSAHKKTRVIIECCFGRWKGMFKALSNNMQISLSTVKAAIVAMAVLYNIKLEYDNNWEYDDVYDNESSGNDSDFEDEENVVGDRTDFRKQFIRKYFTN